MEFNDMSYQNRSDELYQEWKAELAFIQSVNPKLPGKSFSYDSDCFARYCNMQANSAKRQGYPLIAHEILQSRDIAQPNYRSNAREQGLIVVDGVFVVENEVLFY